MLIVKQTTKWLCTVLRAASSSSIGLVYEPLGPVFCSFLGPSLGLFQTCIIFKDQKDPVLAHVKVKLSTPYILKLVGKTTSLTAG